MAKKETSFKEAFLKNIPWLVGILVAVLNIWLSYQLSPINEALVKTSVRVLAVETWVDKHEQYSVRIEEKLDQLIKDVSAINARCK